MKFYRYRVGESRITVSLPMEAGLAEDISRSLVLPEDEKLVPVPAWTGPGGF